MTHRCLTVSGNGHAQVRSLKFTQGPHKKAVGRLASHAELSLSLYLLLVFSSCLVCDYCDPAEHSCSTQLTTLVGTCLTAEVLEAVHEVQTACVAMPVSIPSDAGPAETFQELLSEAQ